MSRAHDNWVAAQERDYQRLRGYEHGGAAAHPPDDQGADEGACGLWIRRCGWSARIEPWMLEWVAADRS